MYNKVPQDHSDFSLIRETRILWTVLSEELNGMFEDLVQTNQKKKKLGLEILTGYNLNLTR